MIIYGIVNQKKHTLKTQNLNEYGGRMDTSGRIRNLMEDEEPSLNEIALSDEQANELSKRSPRKRKNWMRNKPCPCGSGKKMKKCCWSRMAFMSEENR